MKNLVMCDCGECEAVIDVPEGREKDPWFFKNYGWSMVQSATGKVHLCPTHYRAKDFVRCDDPECWMNKQRADHAKRFPSLGDSRAPHCHPVF